VAFAIINHAKQEITVALDHEAEEFRACCTISSAEGLRSGAVIQ
jgi:hypothetical protein